MLIAQVLALALTPTALFAIPTLAKLQDVFGTSTGSNMALAKTKVTVLNHLLIDTKVTLHHCRGKDESTKQKLAWDYVAQGKTTAPGIDVQFETNTYGNRYSVFFN